MSWFWQSLPYLSAVMGVAAVALLARHVAAKSKDIGQFFEDSLDEYRKNKWKRLAAHGPLAATVLSFIMLFGFFFRLWRPADWRARVDAALVQAGYPLALNFELFCGFVALVGLIGIGLGIVMSVGLFREINPPLFFAFTAVGFYWPVIWLREKSQKRKWEIAKELPYKIDLVMLSVEAGMDLQTAIENLVRRDHTDSPLREELFLMLQEMRVGKTRREAMQHMAARLDLDSINSLVGNLIQGEEMGTPIAQVLRAQAEMIRLQRSYRAEKLAGQAPVKIIFPLLFIFCAVFLVLFGSILVRYWRGEFSL